MRDVTAPRAAIRQMGQRADATARRRVHLALVAERAHLQRSLLGCPIIPAWCPRTSSIDAFVVALRSWSVCLYVDVDGAPRNEKTPSSLSDDELLLPLRWYDGTFLNKTTSWLPNFSASWLPHYSQLEELLGRLGADVLLLMPRRLERERLDVAVGGRTRCVRRVAKQHKFDESCLRPDRTTVPLLDGRDGGGAGRRRAAVVRRRRRRRRRATRARHKLEQRLSTEKVRTRKIDQPRNRQIESPSTNY